MSQRTPPRATGYPKLCLRCQSCESQNANELWDELPRLRNRAEYIIVDTPGTSEMIRQVLMRCDVAVIPSKAGRLEADPLLASVRILKQAQRFEMGTASTSCSRRLERNFAIRATCGSSASNFEYRSQNRRLFLLRGTLMPVTKGRSFGKWARMQERLCRPWTKSSMNSCQRRGHKWGSANE